MIQTKLSVGPSGDRYEQEADLVARAVMRVLHGQPMRAHVVDPSTAMDRVQPGRTGAPSDPTNTNGRTDLGDRIQPMTGCRAPVRDRVDALTSASRIQARTIAPMVGAEGGSLDTDTDSRIRRAIGGGASLDPGLRESMQGAFGADFSAVRIHDNAEANELNQRIQAKAFTTGSDIFFGRGEYKPSSRSGQELIAHELTHILQQDGATTSRRAHRIQRKVTVDQLSLKYRDMVKPLMGRLAGFPHLEKRALLEQSRKQFGDFCRSDESTVPDAEARIDALESEIDQADEALAWYRDGYRIMSEAIANLGTQQNQGSYEHWKPRFDAFASDPLSLRWEEVERARTSSSDFASALNKLKDKHPDKLRAQAEAQAQRLAAESEKAAIASAAAAAKVAAAQEAAAAEQRRRDDITAFVKGHNATQVFTKYHVALEGAVTTVGQKYAGGEDPKTGEFEDGERTYSRKYTFALDPGVGEVHIHWRPFGQSWKPTKWHFKRAGFEHKTGAQHQYNLSKSEVERLGIVAQDREKLTDTEVGK